MRAIFYEHHTHSRASGASATYELAAASAGSLSATNEDATVDSKADADLQPRFVQARESVVKTYGKIDDVPDDRILATATGILTRAGATDWDDLVRLVARELGFARAGSKIRERVEATLHAELRVGSLRRVGDRVAVATPLS